jgi:hypothetical protein
MTAQTSTVQRSNRVPFYVGLVAALVAIALSIFGMIRSSGLASIKPVSLLLVVLIAGGSWGLVAWAITTAVYDVEDDIGRPDADDEEKALESMDVTDHQGTHE